MFGQLSNLGTWELRTWLGGDREENGQDGGQSVPTVCFLSDGPWPLGQEEACAQSKERKGGCGKQQLVNVKTVLDWVWKSPGSRLSPVCTVHGHITDSFFSICVMCKIYQIVC